MVGIGGSHHASAPFGIRPAVPWNHVLSQAVSSPGPISPPCEGLRQSYPIRAKTTKEPGVVNPVSLENCAASDGRQTSVSKQNPINPNMFAAGKTCFVHIVLPSYGGLLRILEGLALPLQYRLSQDAVPRSRKEWRQIPVPTRRHGRDLYRNPDLATRERLCRCARKPRCERVRRHRNTGESSHSSHRLPTQGFLGPAWQPAAAF